MKVPREWDIMDAMAQRDTWVCYHRLGYGVKGVCLSVNVANTDEIMDSLIGSV